MAIDIEREDYYYNRENEERTKGRLNKMNEIGLSDLGNSEFGVSGIMSGLYIEKVWNYSNEDFESYLNWTKDLLNLKKNIT